MMVTKKKIALDMLEYLQKNPGVCARGNTVGWTWVRCNDGQWQSVRYHSGTDRLSSYVEGRVVDEEFVIDWLIQKPVCLIPESEASLGVSAGNTVWEDAQHQDVFAPFERCFWCGESEQVCDVGQFNTTEDGECYLCKHCQESWNRADQIVGPVQTGSV